MAVERFPVEATHIMMFARAIGDLNPVYTDPQSADAAEFGAVIAPPTFTMAGAQFDPENTVRPKPGQPWFGSASQPSGAKREATGRLHAEQHFEYFRPVLAGEVLTARERVGNSWTKESKKGGTLSFEEKHIDYFTVDGNELVITATMVTVVPTPPTAPIENSSAASVAGN